MLLLLKIKYFLIIDNNFIFQIESYTIMYNNLFDFFLISIDEAVGYG